MNDDAIMSKTNSDVATSSKDSDDVRTSSDIDLVERNDDVSSGSSNANMGSLGGGDNVSSTVPSGSDDGNSTQPITKSNKKKRPSLSHELDGSYWSLTPRPRVPSHASSPPKSLPSRKKPDLLTPTPKNPKSSTPSKTPLRAISTSSPTTLTTTTTQTTTTTKTASSLPVTKKEKKARTVGRAPSPKRLFVDQPEDEKTETDGRVELDGDYWASFNPNSSRSKPRKEDSVDPNDLKYWDSRNLKKNKKIEKVEETEEQKQRRLEKQRVKQEECERLKHETDKRLRQKEKEAKIGKEIFPGVFLGGRKVAKNIQFLNDQNIKFVINVTTEVNNFHEGIGITYKRIEVADSSSTNLLSHFDRISDTIAEALKHSKVLVHCQEGKSRSPTVVIAYAMKVLGKTLKDAYITLEETKPDIKINSGFQHQLMKYEKALNDGVCSFDFLSRSSRSGTA